MAKKLQLPDGPVYDSSGNIIGFGQKRYSQPMGNTMQQVIKQSAAREALTPPLEADNTVSQKLMEGTRFLKDKRPAQNREQIQQRNQNEENIQQIYKFFGGGPQGAIVREASSGNLPKFEPYPEGNVKKWTDVLFQKPDTSGLEKFGGEVKEVLRRLIFGQPKSQVATSSIPQVLAAHQQTAAPTPTPTPTQAPVPTLTPPPDKSALPYFEAINISAKEKNVPQDILYRVLRKESMGFNPDVINGNIKSPAGAMGIAQFMPKTAEGIGLDPLNPDEAIPAAAKYLAAKFKEFGSWELALAAYNAGGGTVYDYMNGTNKTGGNPNHLITGGVPPYQETENYVKSILEGLDI